MTYSQTYKWPAQCPIDKKGWAYLQNKYKLTPRELQVCYCACRGMTYLEICKHLKIRMPTLKTHLKNAYLRVQVDNKIMMLLTFLQDIKKDKTIK